MIETRAQFKTMLAAARGELDHMTSTRFRKIIAALDHNQASAAAIFGYAPRHGRRWALGESPIPYPVGWCLEHMARGKI